eukprot:483107-Alexandrium_andersonii.AAC.1
MCGLKPITVVAELRARHLRWEATRSTVLQLLMGKHVGDLKLAGEKQGAAGRIAKLESAFSRPKLAWHTFVNCGVRRVQDTPRR